MRFEIRRRPNFCFNAGLNKRKDDEGGGGGSLIINWTVVYERIERVKYAWDEVDQSFFLPWSPPISPLQRRPGILPRNAGARSTTRFYRGAKDFIPKISFSLLKPLYTQYTWLKLDKGCVKRPPPLYMMFTPLTAWGSGQINTIRYIFLPLPLH